MNQLVLSSLETATEKLNFKRGKVKVFRFLLDKFYRTIQPFFPKDSTAFVQRRNIKMHKNENDVYELSFSFQLDEQVLLNVKIHFDPIHLNQVDKCFIASNTSFSYENVEGFSRKEELRLREDMTLKRIIPYLNQLVDKFLIEYLAWCEDQQKDVFLYFQKGHIQKPENSLYQTNIFHAEQIIQTSRSAKHYDSFYICQTDIQVKRNLKEYFGLYQQLIKKISDNPYVTKIIHRTTTFHEFINSFFTHFSDTTKTKVLVNFVYKGSYFSLNYKGDFSNELTLDYHKKQGRSNNYSYYDSVSFSYNDASNQLILLLENFLEEDELSLLVQPDTHHLKNILIQLLDVDRMYLNGLTQELNQQFNTFYLTLMEKLQFNYHELNYHMAKLASDPEYRQQHLEFHQIDLTVQNKEQSVYRLLLKNNKHTQAALIGRNHDFNDEIEFLQIIH